ncbi:hypothetical protein BHE74_00058140, partial [Ensete ventricosum]
HQASGIDGLVDKRHIFGTTPAGKKARQGKEGKVSRAKASYCQESMPGDKTRQLMQEKSHLQHRIAAEILQKKAALVPGGRWTSNSKLLPSPWQMMASQKPHRILTCPSWVGRGKLEVNARGQ